MPQRTHRRCPRGGSQAGPQCGDTLRINTEPEEAGAPGPCEQEGEALGVPQVLPCMGRLRPRRAGLSQGVAPVVGGGPHLPTPRLRASLRPEALVKLPLEDPVNCRGEDYQWGSTLSFAFPVRTHTRWVPCHPQECRACLGPERQSWRRRPLARGGDG